MGVISDPKKLNFTEVRRGSIQVAEVRRGPPRSAEVRELLYQVAEVREVREVPGGYGRGLRGSRCAGLYRFFM